MPGHARRTFAEFARVAGSENLRARALDVGISVGRIGSGHGVLHGSCTSWRRLRFREELGFERLVRRVTVNRDSWRVGVFERVPLRLGEEMWALGEIALSCGSSTQYLPRPRAESI